MTERNREGRKKSARRMTPGVEGLENRDLFARAGLPLGVFMPPLHVFLPGGVTAPRVDRHGVQVNPHVAVNRVIRQTFGPPIDGLIRQADARSAAERNRLADQVLGNPFMNAVLGMNDTYALLRSTPVSTGIFYDDGGELPAEFVVFEPPGVIGDVDMGLRLIQVGNPGATVQFTVDGSIPVITNGGVRFIRIPTDTLPEETRQLLAGLSGDAERSRGVFTGISEDILLALETSRPTEAPRAADTVPGLRLFPREVLSGNNFPNLADTPFRRYLRIAENKRLFRLNERQLQNVTEAIGNFYEELLVRFQNGDFQTPDPSPVDLPVGPLSGTLSVTLGSLREFFLDPRIGSGRSGLNLPGFADTPDTTGFPGRIDVGWVFDRQGNFGLILTARNTMSNTVPGQAEANKIAAEIGVEVSNAANIQSLSGFRTVEALSLGSAVSAGLSVTNQDGVATYGASVGYGSGLEFGTGARLTRVIPLGNVLAPRFR